MFLCVTHVDAVTKIPCTEAPMSHGPSFPDVDGLNIVWWNQTQWPTDKPLFYGTCADTANTDVPGVIKVLTEEQYLSMRETETAIKSMQVRNERDFKIRSEIDVYNPIRWESLTEEQKQLLKVYRSELLDVPQQAGFPWEVVWPTRPTL